MPGIDEFLLFQPLNFAVLTVLDAQTKSQDIGGDLLAKAIKGEGHHLAERDWVKDDVTLIAERVTDWSKSEAIQVILTVGGTGLTGRAVTIDALKPLFNKTVDGFSILFHQLSYKAFGVTTLQSRVSAGTISETLVFCLPRSTAAVKQAWDDIIREALDSRYRPSSLVDILPRLVE